MPNDYFAARLKQLREKAKLSQGELGRALGVSRGAISYYENQERIPNIDFLQDVSGYFNVSVEYLLGHSNSYQQQTSIPFYMKQISDEAFSNLEKILDDDDDIELFNNLFSNSRILTFFHYFHQLVQAINIQRKIDIESDSNILISENLTFNEDYMIFILTNYWVDLLREIANKQAWKDIDVIEYQNTLNASIKKTKAKLELLQKEIDEQTSKNYAELMKQNAKRLEVLQRIHEDKSLED